MSDKKINANEYEINKKIFSEWNLSDNLIKFSTDICFKILF